MKQVFISYSSKEEHIAKKVCNHLERHHINCWLACRDIESGEPYAREIVRGIKDTKIVVLLYSANANNSENVLNEMDQAFRLNRSILPFQLEKTPMSDELQYYLSRRQWIDASDNHVEKLPVLVEACKKSLGINNSMKVDNGTLTPRWASFTTDAQREVLSTLINNMVEIDGGAFSMGATYEQCSDAYEWEKPVHRVTLSNYFILQHPVTQEQWDAVMPSNPSFNRGKSLPVDSVSWDDCIQFIDALNELSGLTFKLPTEAQWEFAARGGNKHRDLKFSGCNNLDMVGWYEMNSDCVTQPIRHKQANEIGLFDMSGNVWEWCDDWYDVYDKNNVTNPVGATSGTRKVLRGGCCNSNAICCRVSYRIGRNVKYKDRAVGFRLVL